MKESIFLVRPVRVIFSTLLLLFTVGCAAPSPPRPPGVPDPGVLHKENRQEVKFRLGKPEYVEKDKIDEYESRDDGILDNKAVGFKSIWKF